MPWLMNMLSWVGGSLEKCVGRERVCVWYYACQKQVGSVEGFFWRVITVGLLGRGGCRRVWWGGGDGVR